MKTTRPPRNDDMTNTPDTRPSQGTVRPAIGKRYVCRNGFITPSLDLGCNVAFAVGWGYAWNSDGSYVTSYPPPHGMDLIEEYREPATDDLRQQIAAQAERIATLETDAAEAERISDYNHAVLVANVTEREQHQRDLSRERLDAAKREIVYCQNLIKDQGAKLAKFREDKAQPMEGDVEWMVHGNGDVLFFSEEKKARAEAQKLTTLTHDVSLYRSQFVAVCRGRHVWSDMVSP